MLGAICLEELLTADMVCWCLQSVKEHLRGYEKGLADAETTPRTKEAEMAVVQAKLRGYSEVDMPVHMIISQR